MSWDLPVQILSHSQNSIKEKAMPLAIHTLIKISHPLPILWKVTTKLYWMHRSKISLNLYYKMLDTIKTYLESWLPNLKSILVLILLAVFLLLMESTLQANEKTIPHSHRKTKSLYFWTNIHWIWFHKGSIHKWDLFWT